MIHTRHLRCHPRQRGTKTPSLLLSIEQWNVKELIDPYFIINGEQLLSLAGEGVTQ